MAVDLWWNFRETGTNIANNTSTVQLDIYVTTSGSSHYEYDQWGTIWWNGEHSTDAYKLYSNTDNLVHSETQTITHKPDGTGSTTFACAIPTTSAGGTKESGDITIQLTTLPRAASIDSFTCSSNYLDGTMTVKYTPKATFNYKLRLSIPNVVAIVTKDLGSQGTGQKTTTATFTSSELNTIYAKIGANANSCTIGAVIETWSGSTKVGESSEYMLTLYMPESIKPSIGTISLTEAVSGLNAKFGAFVQNKSKANVSFTASGYNAGGITSTIKSYNVNINNQTFTTNSFTTNLLSTSGTNTITVKVTDSRGRIATKSQTFNVLGYTKPTISLFSANRNNTTNTTIDVLFSATISSLNNKNDKTFKIKLDNTDKQTYTDTYSKTNQAYAITGTSSTTSYDVTLSITDYFETVTRTIRVGTAFALMHFTEDGNKIAIGHYYDASAGGVFQIGGKTVLGNSSAHSISADGGTYSGKAATAGTADSATNAGKATFSNKLENINGRITNANIAHTYENNKSHLQLLIATASMTSNKPAADGHILHCSWDNSGQYNGQLFIPNTNGNVPVQFRGCGNGTWGSWENLYRCKNLFNNTSGQSTTITLTESCANFSFVIVYAASNYGGSWNSSIIYNPNGKRVNIFTRTNNSQNQQQYLHMRDLYFNEKTVNQEGRGAWYNVWGTTDMYYNINDEDMKIFRIDGYR